MENTATGDYWGPIWEDLLILVTFDFKIRFYSGYFSEKKCDFNSFSLKNSKNIRISRDLLNITRSP